MNIYDTIDQAWLGLMSQVISEGHEFESRVGVCFEIIGKCFTLSNLDSTFMTNDCRKLQLQYAAAELLWYLRFESNISMISAYAPSYKQYANNNTAHGSYGSRMLNDEAFCLLKNESHHNQLHYIIDLLNKSPNTRQAVVTMWCGGDLIHALNDDKNDIPCTTTWQFILRDKVLYMICNMRSGDIWLGLPYDVFVNTCIQRLIASATNSAPGTYTHCVGSLHLYQKNLQSACNAAHGTISYKEHNWDTVRKEDIFVDIAKALEFEHEARIEKFANYECLEHVHPVLSDAALLCASKWLAIDEDLISSAVLRNTFNDNH